MSDPTSDPEPALRKLRAAERAIDNLERESEAFLPEGRKALGVSGDVDVRTLRVGVRASGVGWYPVIALSGLVLVDGLSRVGFAASVPSISRATGLRQGQLNTGLLIGGGALAVSAFATVWLLTRVPRRGLLAVVGGLVAAAALLMAGVATGVWGFNVAFALVGVGLGIAQAVHRPFLMDSYPPDVRIRVMSFYTAAIVVGSMAAVGLLWVLTDVQSFTWRVLFLAIGSIGLVATVVAARLHDPDLGRWDAQRVRKLVDDSRGGEPVEPNGGRDDVDPADQATFAVSFAEQLRMTLRPKTMKPMLMTFFVVGAFVGPVQVYVGALLESRWQMTALEQWGMYSIFSAFALAALVLFARRADALFQGNPARLLQVMAALMAVGSVALGVVTFAGALAVSVVLIGAAFASLYVLLPAASVVMLSVVPPERRGHASAFAGVMFGLVGMVGGRFLISGIDARYGLRWGFLVFALTGLGVASGVARAGRTARVGPAAAKRDAAPDFDADLDRVAADLIAEEELRVMVTSGRRFPLLGCSRVDFSYGQLQVLFGVNFVVDDGEMVALLGTNGAGKSTLLRILSGIGIPSNGTVHFRGGNITHVDAEQRVRLGIGQVSGGRAVFGGMSVVDNLRASGFGQGLPRRAIERCLDESFDAFPALAARRNQSASVLSGGEQQMLGIARAIMNRPRLLLIDELSLGLSPLVVGHLLETVRAINARGTAIVLVEQSVNIALSLVDHAYFMEKGEIRFDGVASALLERPDLLRSVFLEGATPNT